MQKLFENWRKYTNESIDHGIVERIIEDIELVIEIQVRNLYRSSVINESGGQILKAQLIGSYTDKLMEMIQDRWSASSQHSDLKKLGYSVEIIPIEVTLDENYILMTKELL